MSVTNQNRKMTDFNYKEYSLEKLEEWIHDALSSAEASPHEIYSAIKKAVQEEYNIHKEYSQRCFGLLELLSGHRPVNLDDDWENHYYPEETKRPVDNPDGISFPNNSVYDNMSFSFDTSDSQYTYPTEYIFDPAGNNIFDLITEPPKKWTLPVEVDGASGEYYVQLPDDLLNSLGWKEGDTLEFADNKDSTFSLKKVSGISN